MSWVWIAGAGAIAAYFWAWAVFFNRAREEPEPRLRTVLTEALAFYTKMTFVFKPMVKPGLGVSFVRVVPVRENRSLLSEGRDRRLRGWGTSLSRQMGGRASKIGRAHV